MRGWHLIPLGFVLAVLVALPVAALTDTGIEHEVRDQLGLDGGECEPTINPGSAWTEADGLPYPLDEPRGATLDGEVYLVGGITGLRQGSDGLLLLEPSDELTRFDPATGRFTNLAPLPEKLNHIGVVAHDHSLYVLGGYGATLDHGTRPGFYRYDPAVDRWSELPDMPEPRAAMAAGVIGNRLIVAGGALDDRARADAFEFEFEDGRWRRLPPMLSRREHVGATVLGDDLYVLGGRAPNTLAVDTAERYDVSAGRWRQMPSMPVPSGGLGAVSVAGKVITVGGGDDAAGSVTGAVQEWDPQTKHWSYLSPMRTPRHGHATAAVGGRIWVFGGSPCAYFNATDSVETVAPRGG